MDYSKYIVPAGTILDYSRGTRYYEDSFCYSKEKDEKPLESIKIPEGIKIIAESCFAGCSKLKQVEIPNSVKLIDEGAFADCRNLHHFEWPSELEEIGPFAFWNTPLKNYDLPETLRAISFNVFNKNLDVVKIPSSLTHCSDHVCGNYAKTVEVLLRNPAYKLIDNCIINSNNHILLFINPRAQSVVIPRDVHCWTNIKFNGSKIVIPVELFNNQENIWDNLKYRSSAIYTKTLTVFSEYSEKVQKKYDDLCSKDELFKEKIKYKIIDSYDIYITRQSSNFSNASNTK